MSALKHLYPSIEPFDSFELDVGDGHVLYVEQCGSKTGIPVVVLHGGPGGGCSPFMRRFFNPEIYRIILFDQRGCGRSTPHSSVENNTTWHLISDIELIRFRLKINRWIVFGGSWGSTLGLLYSQAHPDRIACLVLRGIFLHSKEELNWFYGGGAGRFWPKEWNDFIKEIPLVERGDLILAYNKRLFSGDINNQTHFAQLWAVWENRMAAMAGDRTNTLPPGRYSLAFSRIENHYFINNGFLEIDNQILRDMDNISHIKGYVVHGRYDMICPPIAAHNLVEKWANCELNILPNAGHALSEEPIAYQLVKIMNELVLKKEDLYL
ncbi:prolyl aminopeptidase [Rhodobacteraceae bacterium]|nr:prolyl aminopeptidase [Paracoccaceae bacterium]